MATPKLILSDSNILIYASNPSSSKHKQARKFLESNQTNIVITHQNLNETYRVITHSKFPQPQSPYQAKNYISDISSQFRIILPQIWTYELTLELIRKNNITGNHIFDTYLAATALSNEIFSLATDNTKDFEKYPQLELINPF